MITSTANPQVKYVRSLYDRRTRHAERLVPVEGLRLVEEVLRAGVHPWRLYYDPESTQGSSRARAVLDRLQDVEQVEVADRVLRALSDTQSPQGMVAVVPLPPPAEALVGDLVLLLAGLQDPGNLGTILRTAEAAWVETVVGTRETVDPFSSKAVRAGMGAQFRLRLIWDRDWAEIVDLTAGRERRLAAAGPGLRYDQVDWLRPSALIIGSEAWGAGPEAEDLADVRVSIPMRPDVESLNAAVAAGVILFEAARVRH